MTKEKGSDVRRNNVASTGFPPKLSCVELKIENNFVRGPSAFLDLDLVYVCDMWVCVCGLRSFSSNIFVRSASLLRWTRSSGSCWNDEQPARTMLLLLTRARVPAHQEHVALVANANGFRGVRQGCGVVATSVAKDFAAVSTVVLQQTWFILISKGRTGRRRSVYKLSSDKINDDVSRIIILLINLFWIKC